MLPHQMSRVTDGSSTTNLSRTDRPVWTPVSTINDPSIDSLPSRRRSDSATRAGAVRLGCTGRPACTPVPASADGTCFDGFSEYCVNVRFLSVSPALVPFGCRPVEILFCPRAQGSRLAGAKAHRPVIFDQTAPEEGGT